MPSYPNISSKKMQPMLQISLFASNFLALLISGAEYLLVSTEGTLPYERRSATLSAEMECSCMISLDLKLLFSPHRAIQKGVMHVWVIPRSLRPRRASKTPLKIQSFQVQLKDEYSASLRFLNNRSRYVKQYSCRMFQRPHTLTILWSDMTWSLSKSPRFQKMISGRDVLSCSF